MVQFIKGGCIMIEFSEKYTLQYISLHRKSIRKVPHKNKISHDIAPAMVSAKWLVFVMILAHFSEWMMMMENN